MSASTVQDSSDALRKQAKEVVDALSSERLQSAHDFLRWLQQLEDDAEIAMLSGSKQLRDELDRQREAVRTGGGVDWRKVRDDV